MRNRIPGRWWGLAALPVVSLLIPLTGLSGGVAVAAAGLPSCGHLSQQVTVSRASYGEGVLVSFAESLTNRSNHSCTLGTGPSSPLLTIVNSKGTVVWNDCTGNGGVGACPQYLLLRTLKGKGRYREAFTWNQLEGNPGRQAPIGTYRVLMKYRYDTSVSFSLTGSR
jgi:hypothetical protein